MKTSFNKRGFTFIEVLVAVAILAILASVALFSLQGPKQKARDTQRISDISSLKLALKMYSQVNNGYPLGGPTIIGEGGSLDNPLSKYLAGSIADPLSDATHKYIYENSSSDCGGKRVVYAKKMEGVNSGNWPAICGSASPSGENRYGVILY